MHRSILISTLLLFFVASLAFTGNAESQSLTEKRRTGDERAAITSAAQSYMDAYYTGDAARMDQALHPNFHKRTLQTTNDQVAVQEDGRLSMLAGVTSGSGKLIPVSERVQKIEVFDVYKNAANVKVVTGRWVDYMLLSKANGEWRVLDVVLQYRNR